MSTLLKVLKGCDRHRAVPAAAAACTAVALLLGGCTIGDVSDRTGGGSGETGAPEPTGSAPSPSAPADPSPSVPSSPSSPSAPQPGGALDVPEDTGRVGVALLDGDELRTGGSLASGQSADTAAAWSTIKVPLAIAALRNSAGGELTDAMRQAITASDNAAAEELWASLGTPQQAASAVQGVLAEAGDTQTTVPSERSRPEFSIFGQTVWTPEQQVTFARGLQCLDGAEPVLTAMGQIAAGQDYGLGRFDGARFKGGWGPSSDGGYLVRQFGLVPAQDGTLVPVAVSASAEDGSYESAQRVLDSALDSLRGTVTGAHGVPSGGNCS